MSLASEIKSLWSEGPGAISASPSSFISEEPAVQRRQVLALRFWICYMVLTGGAVDYMVGVFNDFARREGFEYTALSDEDAVFIVTVFSFLASAVPPSLSKANRESLRDVNVQDPKFKYKVLVPGLADMAITSMLYTAILFVAPAIVSMLKTSSQLVTLTLIQHFRGKTITWKMCICLLFSMLGQIVVTYSATLGQTDMNEDPDHTGLGLSLAIASGMTGAVRNVLEEIILQGNDLTTGGLLAAESWISLLAVLATTLTWQAPRLERFIQGAAALLAMPVVWLFLAIIMFCTYGKDFGKLFVVKHGNALIAKVLTMMFPIITWALSLLTFLQTDGQYGEGLRYPSSAARLVGFVVIAAASITFVILQKKK